MLHEKTIITSDLEADPRKKTEDMFTRNVLGVSIQGWSPQLENP